MDYEKKYNEALKWMRELYPGLHGATKEDAEHFFPELRESEDERIRKYLIEELKAAKSVGELKFIIPQPTREECIAYLEKQKEQKPVDYDHEMWKNCEANFEGGKKEVIDHPEKYGLRKEQKPAEWSEEDKDYYDTIVRKLEIIGDDCGLSNNQIKFLREHCPSHRSKWSEEDETIIEGACSALEIYGHTKLAGRLKSLRPQSQGVYKTAIESILKMCESYEKKGIFTDERAIDFLGNVRVKCKDAVECAPILDEPSWKPSEEQMNCLCAAVDAAIRKHNESVGGYKPARVLKSLYEDLKNLI